MSTTEADVDVTPGQAYVSAPAAEAELTSARIARVGDIEVRRLLPLRRRRSVGAWCFVDHYGPMSVDGVAGMQVPPHPHIGLQTVTWLIEGGLRATVFAGELAGARSPARVYSPLVGAELSAPRQARALVPLDPGFEHVLFVAQGSAEADGTLLAPGSLLYLDTGHSPVSVAATEGTRLFLLGGEPLGETLLMWWNFVGRTADDITARRTGRSRQSASAGCPGTTGRRWRHRRWMRSGSAGGGDRR